MTSVLRNSSIAARSEVTEFSVKNVEKITEKEEGRPQPRNVGIAAKDGPHSIVKAHVESLTLRNLVSKGLLPEQEDSSTSSKILQDSSSISNSNTVPPRQQSPGAKPGDNKSADRVLRKGRLQSKPVLALDREICRKSDKKISQSRGRYLGKKPPSDGDGLFIDKKPSKVEAKSKKCASTATGPEKSRKGFFF